MPEACFPRGGAGQDVRRTNIALAFAVVFALVPARTHADPASSKKVVSPTAFGRVFETNRPSIVRVQAKRALDVWATGFIIGAEGEVVFGAKEAPEPTLRVRTADGVERDADLLGFDVAISLAIARIHTEGVAKGELSPLHVANAPGLFERQWVVVIKHDAKGRPEPFAGVVEGDPAEDPKRKSPLRVRVAPVFAPGAPGSPVLNAEGELIGVALAEGARSTQVAAIETIVPFLKAVVLGKR